MISLGAGAPSASYFPFKEIEVTMSNPPGYPGTTEEAESVIRMAKYDFEPGVSDYSKSSIKLCVFLSIAFIHTTGFRLGRCPELWSRLGCCAAVTLCDGAH